MWKILMCLSILSVSNGAFALKIAMPEEELIKFEAVLEPKSVSSRTGPRTKWENVQKLHQDGMFKDGLGWASPYCLSFSNDITLEEGTMIKMNCNAYDPKLGAVKDEPIILK